MGSRRHGEDRERQRTGEGKRSGEEGTKGSGVPKGKEDLICGTLHDIETRWTERETASEREEKRETGSQLTVVCVLYPVREREGEKNREREK